MRTEHAAEQPQQHSRAQIEAALQHQHLQQYKVRIPYGGVEHDGGTGGSGQQGNSQ